MKNLINKMDIKVKVILGSKEKSIEKKEDKYIVRVTLAPDKGKANKELIKILSAYFNTPKSMIRITKGFKVRNKVVRIIWNTS